MNRRTTRTFLAAATVPLVLLVGACGTDSDDQASPSAPTSPAAASQADDQQADDPQAGDQQTGTAGNTSGNGGGDAAISAAARTALAEVGGTVVNVDEQVDGWEVDLVADDGTETSIVLSADGTRAGDPLPDDGSDNDEADDVTENQQLLQAATVDWAAALETARAELGDAAIDELDLGEDDGSIVWEVSTAGTGTETTVVIDAASGDVIRTGTDD